MLPPDLYQICYSRSVRGRLGDGFKMMGDIANPRPDWREYWHIRQFLIANDLQPDRFYGFFSPRFTEKTGLRHSDVINFANQHSNTDVILFSPFPDVSALYLSVAEHAAFEHAELIPGMYQLCSRFFPRLNPGLLVAASNTTVYCNFFIAKRRFWSRWFEICERIFSEVEAASELGRSLSPLGTYKGEAISGKVFIIERVASMMLADWKNLKVTAYPPYGMALMVPSLEYNRDVLFALDAIKLACARELTSHYLAAYFNLRVNLFEALAKKGNTRHAWTLSRMQARSKFLRKQFGIAT